MRMTEIRHRLSEHVDALRDEVVEDLCGLVKIPSVIGTEKLAQEFMVEKYRKLGLEVLLVQPDIRKVKEHPGFIDTGMSYESRPNVIGILPGSPEGRSIILNGHVDVVSPEPVRAWTYPPWEATVVGEKIFGRGAGDTKAGLIAACFALKTLLDLGLRPLGEVMLQSVIDEEGGGAGGTLYCLHEGFTADGMICTEPHDLQITMSHAGLNYFRVNVLGRSYHAGMAHLGVNAIEKMYLIIQALSALDAKRGREIRFPLFEKGSGRSCHITIGTLKAGDWPSTAAGSAVMEGRVSYVPGENTADIKQMIESAVFSAARKDAWLREHPPTVEWFGWQTEPWYQDPEDPFVSSLRLAAENILGYRPELIGRASGIDSRFSSYFNMPAACTGPKAMNIHGIDEWVDIPSILTLIKILALKTINWCGCQ